MTNQKDKDTEDGSLITEMVIGEERSSSGLGGLLVEEDAGEETDSFAMHLQETLAETESAVLSIDAVSSDPRQSYSWQRARSLVQEFNPVPWFIWRLSNFVLGQPGKVNPVSEGMVYGLRRLVFATASDDILGAGIKINNVHRALREVRPDVLAASAVIHAICRRLATRQFERIWRPIIDDALIRARIGFEVGMHVPDFGSGRGMLAGFSGRSGLAVLITSGTLDQARRALEMLATGTEIRDVGLAIYECAPLQVSAMALSAAGCGRDAAFGTVSYGSAASSDVLETLEQKRWYAAFSVIERVRMGHADQIDDQSWEVLGFDSDELKEDLLEEVKQVVRRGHGWSWIS